MMTPSRQRDILASKITRQASKQTYLIFRLLADRDRVQDANRAYAYFRWVDDILDSPSDGPVLSGTQPSQMAPGSQEKNIEFVKRQRGLLEDLYRGVLPLDLSPPEELLVDLVQGDPNRESGLYLYLDNMMKVMEIDAERRGREITGRELDDYTTALAVSVTEVLHYFIGHDQPEPLTEDRYLAVKAAHIAHLLRDALKDSQDGYYNIPREYLEEHGITPFDVRSEAYRSWVCSRVDLAREYFRTGQSYISRGGNFRRRLTGLAYTARFEWVLQIIEREKYCLREQYADRKKLPATLWMIWNILRSFLRSPFRKQSYIPLSQPKDEINKT